MAVSKSIAGTTLVHANRRALRPGAEALEQRTVMNGTSVSVGISAAALNPSGRYNHIDEARHDAQAALGTISGTVANNATGKVLKGVQVQLLDSNGNLVGRTVTGVRGRYMFKVNTNGAYVVREVTPKRFTQTSPTFAYTKPVKSYAPSAGNNSWSYATGNNNPAFGPVGVYAWDTVAPAGDLPFESPINITVPPIDLTPYLSVSLNDAVPTDIINNGHQIQVQFPGSSTTSINLGGTEFELAQFHYHDPSENTVNGQGYSMEQHMVFTSAAGAETVLATFLQLGAYNAALQPILDAATSALTTAGSSTTISSAIDFAGLLPTSLSGWFYQGSLTTPALSQPVNWLVLSTPITLDYTQLQQYEAVAKGAGFLPNNRPVQPLDGRQVNEFDFNVNFQSQSVGGLNFTLTRNS
jgi:carbonic anhydrase